jgi:hypothetical protein
MTLGPKPYGSPGRHDAADGSARHVLAALRARRRWYLSDVATVRAGKFPSDPRAGRGDSSSVPVTVFTIGHQNAQNGLRSVNKWFWINVSDHSSQPLRDLRPRTTTSFKQL